MKKELDEALCRDFPNLYRDRNGDMRETCMVWGFPGDGWYNLIRNLSEKLEAEILKLPEQDRHLYRASQVKEKFGGLRYYMVASTPEMEKYISEAENKSEHICEICGDDGSYLLNYRGWYKTRCNKHVDD